MRKRWVFLLGIIAIATLGGCSSSNQSTPKAPQKVTQKATQPTAKQNGTALAKVMRQVKHETVEINQTDLFASPPQTISMLKKMPGMSFFAGEVTQWQVLPAREPKTGYIETAIVIKVERDLKGAKPIKKQQLVNVVLHGGFTKGQELMKPVLKAPTKAKTTGINQQTVTYENAPGYRLPMPGEKVVIFANRMIQPFEPYSALYKQRPTFRMGWSAYFGLWIKNKQGSYDDVWQHKSDKDTTFSEPLVNQTINDLMKS